jgi:hypothetical protein
MHATVNYVGVTCGYPRLCVYLEWQCPEHEQRHLPAGGEGEAQGDGQAEDELQQLAQRRAQHAVHLGGTQTQKGTHSEGGSEKGRKEGLREEKVWPIL